MMSWSGCGEITRHDSGPDEATDPDHCVWARRAAALGKGFREPSAPPDGQGIFGFGAWSHPFWFVGPEPGLAEDSEVLSIAKEWRKDAEDLYDCRTYHLRIGVTEWHEKGSLQTTWSKLIRLLLSAKTERADVTSNDVRLYQRNRWGSRSSDGETCVIELSGLAAKNVIAGEQQSQALLPEGEWNLLLAERLSMLRRRLAEHRPKLVLCYGTGNISRYRTLIQRDISEGDVITAQGTVFALAYHPASPKGSSNAYWDSLGQRIGQHLRQL